MRIENLTLEAERRNRTPKPRTWLGFLAASLFYWLVSLRQPFAWGIVLWMLLAFLVVPLLTAVIVGTERVAGRRLGVSLKSAGLAMFGYTFIGAWQAHARIRSADAGSAIGVILLISIVYAIGAAAVFFGASTALAVIRRSREERSR